MRQNTLILCDVKPEQCIVPSLASSCSDLDLERGEP